MATTAVELIVDQNRIAPAIQAAGEKLDGTDSSVVLDFSGVSRVDTNAIRALEEFARRAEGKAVKPVLRGVNVDVYKALKLVKLASRFSFASETGDGPSQKKK